MNTIQKTLLKEIAFQLFHKGEKQTITKEVVKEARIQALSSLITEDFQVISNNIRVSAAHSELTEVLGDTPFVTIKGFASAYYYSDPIKRVMGDVDFYVLPQNYTRAYKTLLSNEFRKTSLEHERHDAFVKNGIHFELHSEIKGIPNGKDGINTSSKTAEKAVRKYLSDIVMTAQRIETQHGVVVIPDEFHHGLTMLLHVAGHIINDGGVGLRHICDWAVYVDRVDIYKYRKQFVEMGLWRFACILTAVSSKYLGVQKRMWCDHISDETKKLFIEDVLADGNFGRKTAGKKNTLRIANGKNLLLVIKELVEERYAFCHDKPLLLPFGVIMYTTQYVYKRLFGKAKWVKLRTIKEGNDRKTLYEQFGLL